MKTALVIVDLQNDYFPNGDWELKGTEKAAGNAAKLLNYARKKNMPVVHVRHEFPNNDAPFFKPNSKGAEIHASVINQEGEPVVLKQEINSFKNTNLKEILDENNIENLWICGAMSHMCIDAVTRAASDFGYNCTVAHDACATLDLTFNGVTVPAEQVHAAYMAALQFAYAKVLATEEIIG
ncbi:cysteine hydrolase family protein [Tenacibaculum sp. C7A-26P2]|uniref:cysteine hydrolase family protein n=1 Tax=Tenacibaculum sp. C7A-26P2 TaxID=3447504 RepID=UPI003F83730A